jgi:hypothetical protein
MVGSGTLDSLVNDLMGHYMIRHHVSQVIEARNVGQSELLLPGR